MSPTPKTRDKGVVLPKWWIDKLVERVDKCELSYGVIAARLTEIVNRPTAWDHGSVSRFLAQKVNTALMADAFAVMFKMPRMQYAPRTWEEVH